MEVFWHTAGTVKTFIFHRFLNVFHSSGVLAISAPRWVQIKKKLPESRGPPNPDRPGMAGGRGVSSARVRVGINPTRVELLSVIVSSYTATAALGGAAPD